jgi:hypothetical protein
MFLPPVETPLASDCNPQSLAPVVPKLLVYQRHSVVILLAFTSVCFHLTAISKKFFLFLSRAFPLSHQTS